MSRRKSDSLVEMVEDIVEETNWEDGHVSQPEFRRSTTAKQVEKGMDRKRGKQQ